MFFVNHLTGQNKAKIKELGEDPNQSVAKELVKEVSVQAYKTVENIDYGFFWLVEKYGFGYDDKTVVNNYSKRFNSQWRSKSLLLFSASLNNPVRQMVFAVVSEYAKNNSLKTIENSLKGLGILGIRSITSSLTIGKITSIITSKIIILLGLKYRLRKAITVILPMGIGSKVAYNGLQMQSFDAQRSLKVLKPKFYNKLYNQNIDTFWFIVSPYLSKTLRHIN